MIENLNINNFKSIKNAKINCNRINIFIGEPNTGKSNLLETLGFLSWMGNGGDIHNYVRFIYFFNLFYDNVTQSPININGILRASSQNTSSKDEFIFDINIESKGSTFTINDKINNSNRGSWQIDLTGVILNHGLDSYYNFIKYYKFKYFERFDRLDYPGLVPPYGQNMYTIIERNKEIREEIKDIFKEFGYKLRLKPKDHTFEFQKQDIDLDFDYPYALLSDTLKRMLFYLIAIESNKNATLVFEEPESHTFPYYTKYLAERIGRDLENQYFIATHNPYLIKTLLEKTNKNEATVFITYVKDYQTKIYQLSEKEVSLLLEHDPFFNLDVFIEDKK